MGRCLSCIRFSASSSLEGIVIFGDAVVDCCIDEDCWDVADMENATDVVGNSLAERSRTTDASSCSNGDRRHVHIT